jgi:amino acid adenylation domain-containing protein
VWLDDIDQSKCIHSLVTEQVKRTPDALAMMDHDKSLTYAEIDSLSDCLAETLQELGVTFEVPVGILLHPSIEVAIAVIGVLKAGGAYVPLDPRFPESRLEEIVKDSALSLAITNSALASLIPSRIPALRIDQQVFQTTKHKVSLNREVALDNIALIRYTSGSTGSPKGVINTHRSIVSRLHSGVVPDFQPGDICGVDTNFGFGTRLLYPFVCGGTVVILPPDSMVDVRRLVGLLEAKCVTSVFLIPTLLNELLRLDSSSLSKLKRLRVVTTGGEVVSTELIGRFTNTFPNTLLVNTYGSNEIGGTATLKLLRAGDSPSKSVGTPLGNTTITILDEFGNILPAGETGEICVSSDHLSRGYLNQPKLTAERFTPASRVAGVGLRLYRTGDLGKKLANGEIEFLGRADRQVKIRGFRVELDEVEVALLKHLDIRQAAVVERTLGNTVQLVAYVVLEPAGNITPPELRKYLRSRVPNYMVPTVFSFLQKLPVTANGKIDRQGLPEPQLHSLSTAERYSSLSVLERQLFELWAELLGIDSFGRDDDFLDLGGDSITAMKLIAAISDATGIRLPVSALFKYSSISKLSEHIQLIQTEGSLDQH